MKWPFFRFKSQRSRWNVEFGEIQKDPQWKPVLDALNCDVNQHIESFTPANVTQFTDLMRMRVQQLRQLHEVQRRLCYMEIPASARARTSLRPPDSGVPLYAVGSLFLDECRRYLLQGQPEWMHAVTGLALDNTYTLDQFIHLQADRQSRAGVTADPNSVFEALINLSEYGHALHGVFHSHRMNGVPQPSSIDHSLQERLDRGGYRTIQCIFSEDGYMRWFSGEHPFELLVYGKGVKKVDENVYQFINGR